MIPFEISSKTGMLYSLKNEECLVKNTHARTHACAHTHTCTYMEGDTSGQKFFWNS